MQLVFKDHIDLFLDVLSCCLGPVVLKDWLSRAKTESSDDSLGRLCLNLAIVVVDLVFKFVKT